MKTLKSTRHIRTSACIKSFRAVRHATGMNLQAVDRRRIQIEEDKHAYMEAQFLQRDKKYEQQDMALLNDTQL